MEKYFGIWPALVTAFDKQGKLNLSAMQQLVEKNIYEGAAGFYVCGSTGESYLLSSDERMAYLEAVMQAVNGRVPVICHVGAMSTSESIALARHANSAGVSAVSSVPPFYFKYSRDEYLSYYRSILDSVSVPLFLYNVPAMSGVNLSDDDISFYFQEPRIAGLKFTSYDLFQYERIHRKHPDRFLFYGHDELFLPALSVGAAAAIGSTYNFSTRLFVKIRKLFLDGKLDEAREKQGKANELIEVMLKIGVMRAVKGILKIRGIDCGDCRLPFAPLSEPEMKLLRDAYDSIRRECE